MTMSSKNPRIAKLKATVEAARGEFDLATTFHELWKPAVFDVNLQARFSFSYAGQGLLVVRSALRREMLLAVMRLWDKSPKSIRMEAVARDIDDKEIISLLVDMRRPSNWPGDREMMLECLSKQALEASDLIKKYCRGGSHFQAFERLQRIRHEHLAHKQIVLQADAEQSPASAEQDEVETFYQDNARLIQLLMHLVCATAYDPLDTGGVYKTYAEYSWAGGRSEKTEGHPNFRPPPPKPLR
jgi:hypothetical protein